MAPQPSTEEAAALLADPFGFGTLEESEAARFEAPAGGADPFGGVFGPVAPLANGGGLPSAPPAAAGGSLDDLVGALGWDE